MLSDHHYDWNYNGEEENRRSRKEGRKGFCYVFSGEGETKEGEGKIQEGKEKKQGGRDTKIGGRGHKGGENRRGRDKAVREG